MSISSDYLKIIEHISEKSSVPQIKEIIVPKKKTRKSNFAAVILKDDTVGLFFINLNVKARSYFQSFNPKKYEGMEALDLAKNFTSKDLIQRSIGMGTINAISQFIFKSCNYLFDFTSDPLGLLEIEAEDVVGMVGFFPPLVDRIESKGNKLIIIEKKPELLKSSKNWSVSLDPSSLEMCNKVLITSTTVLNETIDDILQYCSNAKKTSMIGPTAGFLPDPLFSRGIDIVGGTYVKDSKLLTHSVRESERWGAAVRKYVIKKSDYVGFERLLKKIKE
jgi:uncharacterized protein (DUF4213/DUF364 family)